MCGYFLVKATKHCEGLLILFCLAEVFYVVVTNYFIFQIDRNKYDNDSKETKTNSYLLVATTSF